MEDQALLAELEKNPANLAPDTSEPEVKEVQEPTKEEVKAPEAKDEPTMEELIGKPTEATKEAKKVEENVPLSAFLDIKNELKEVKAALKEAQNSKGNVSSADVAAIAEEFGVDAGFLEQYGKAIATQTQKELEAKFMPLLQKQEAEKRANETNQLFEKIYQDAIAENPEFEKIANKNVIKSLAFHPSNASKTLSEILEETYGNAISGKPSIEVARPAPNKEENVDFDKMTPEQLEQATLDPKQAGRYADWLIKQGGIF